MKILPNTDYFLLNSFTSVAEILDDFPHPGVSRCLLNGTGHNRIKGTNSLYMLLYAIWDLDL
jgi:hypothetical protein